MRSAMLVSPPAIYTETRSLRKFLILGIASVCSVCKTLQTLSITSSVFDTPVNYQGSLNPLSWRIQGGQESNMSPFTFML